MFCIPEYLVLAIQHYVSSPVICCLRMCNTNRGFSECGMADMANQKLYEPPARLHHVSFSVEGKVYLWGGVTQDLLSGHRDELACIEQFDPYLEIWSQLMINTAGTLHPGLKYPPCTLHGEHVYMYGGRGTKHEGVLSCLTFGVRTSTWSQLCPAETVGGPMRKGSCGMVHVHFHDDKLAVIVWASQWPYSAWISVL